MGYKSDAQRKAVHASKAESAATKKTMTEVREEPGMSNAGKYKDVAKDDFCGPKGTYPVNTLKRAKSALKLAHNAGRKAGKIKACVYRKYPELKKDK